MKKTRLNQVHREAGGRLIEFAGWEMPVEYRGLIDEHLAVRTKPAYLMSAIWVKL